MDQFVIYMGLLGIIVCVGVLSGKSTIPSPLFLVIAGMLLSLIPNFPQIQLEPRLVFNVFLPPLVYTMSALSSWPDIKKNKRPIAFLSVGHVIFITVLVGVIAHHYIPALSWPMAFMLGAIISPPDDVAIIAIAEKLRMPQRLITILSGEGLLNDATALILFKFSLAAVITHTFSPFTALSEFFAIILFETLYGLFIGNVIGFLRLKIRDPKLHLMASLLTPFLAYLPVVYLGGSGVLATVVAGFVIGHRFLGRYTPEIRLQARAVWAMIEFTLQSLLFLLVGLNFRSTIMNISSIPYHDLIYYSLVITLTVIIGRFIWVYLAAYLPRYFFPSIRKKDPYPPWQFPFIISWAGVRGAISLAAVLIVPSMHTKIGTVELDDLLIYLVFCVIVATLLLQGITLPWLIKLLGVGKIGLIEEESEHMDELAARHAMIKAVLRFLKDYKSIIKDDPDMSQQVKLQILEYQSLKKRVKEIIDHHKNFEITESHNEYNCLLSVLTQVVEVERTTLTQLWREDKISFKIRTKLVQELDLRSKRLGA